MEIVKIGGLLPSDLTHGLAIPTTQSSTESKGSFSNWIKNSLNEVNVLQQKADISAQKLIIGQSKDIHGTMIEMEKAGIAFNLLMEIRNKIVSAYEEIQRMQL